MITTHYTLEIYWQFYDLDLERYGTTRIVADTIVNGRQYFKKINYRHEIEPKWGDFISWERNDSVSGNSYMLDVQDWNNNGDRIEEFLLDSLHNLEEVGSTYISYKYPSVIFEFGPITAVLKDVFFAEVFNDTVLVKSIEYLDHFYGEIIADKYGVVRTSKEGAPDFLVACKINGIEYGTLVSVNYKDEVTEEKVNKELTVSNYPNPYNNTTIIQYYVPRETNIKIIIYDILGRQIKVIYNGIKSGGDHKILFEDNLPSGIYICTIITSKSRASTKLLKIN